MAFIRFVPPYLSREILLRIGRDLRVQYAAEVDLEAMPPRMAELLKQLHAREDG